MKISDIGSVGNIGNVGSSRSNSSSIDTGVVREGLDIQPEVASHVYQEQENSDQPIIDDDMIEKAVEQANKSLENYNRYIERSVHEKTKAIMYVMKDTKTNEVIREFPPKKIQDMIAKMWELAGLFVDEKA